MSHNDSQLTDQYDRQLNYLRISVTDRCNLRCLYCNPIDTVSKLAHEEILRYEEILRLAEIAVGLGIKKIRLTGGEPLVRKGICEFIPRLTSFTGLKEVTLTTNGICLKEKLEKIRSGGIKRLNISLDSLHREKYRKITGFDGLEKVLESIETARKMGFHPIKINMVPLKGFNDDEIQAFAKLSFQYPYHIRFIEYMPLRVAGGDLSLHHLPTALIKAEISRLGKLHRVQKTVNDGPAERFKFNGAPGEIGFISPMTNHFCPTCNRLRLTARGRLRPCLLSNREEDLKGPMRSGASDHDLARLFKKTAFNKPHAHHLTIGSPTPFSAHMSSIGG